MAKALNLYLSSALALFLIGCSSNGLIAFPTERTDANTRNQYTPPPLPPLKLPVLVVGDLQSSKQVSFIWSYNCNKCRDEFREIFDIFIRARDKKDIGLTFIQYEDDEAMIQREVTPAVCSGSKMYELHLWEYLFHGFNFSKTKTLKDLPTDMSMESCGVNELVVQNDLEAWFHVLRDHVGDPIKSRPVLIAGGEIIKTTRELHTKLLSMDRAGRR